MFSKIQKLKTFKENKQILLFLVNIPKDKKLISNKKINKEKTITIKSRIHS